MKKLFFLICTILSITSCEIVETTSTPVASPLPDGTNVIYKTEYNGTKAYGVFINHYWKGDEIKDLEKIPGGLLLPYKVFTKEVNDSTEIDDASVQIENLLIKLLVKQIQLERELNLYLQDSVHSQTNKGDLEEFFFESNAEESEDAIRLQRFLEKNFSLKEKRLLKELPEGLSIEPKAESLLPKLLVKTVTLEEKITAIQTSPTLRINPKEFIRQYLREHPNALKEGSIRNDSQSSPASWRAFYFQKIMLL